VKYHVFVDFDGTITADDVSYLLFNKFAQGKAEAIVQKYRRGEASAVECLETECRIYNEQPVSEQEINAFIDSRKITDGFVQFVDFCRRHDIKITILSGGFDFYIKRILKSLELDDLAVLATPVVIKDGRIYPEFIYYDAGKCRRCANCKRERIKELTSDDEIPVFIGDGHSDSHGAHQAGIVFAKSYLAEYLDQNRIAYIGYNDFYDVIREFGNIMNETDSGISD
jgi:2-hydroxy-3-keto-5-methylthiopentenyl-1-phosphate phosphatase